MPISHTVFFDDTETRRGYRVRFRGSTLDTTKNVPRKLYQDSGLDSRKESDRARRIAERWAVETAQKLEKSGHQPIRRTEAMRLSEVATLFEHKNPGDVVAETKRRYRTLSANLVRVLGDPFPSAVRDATALDYRNARATEKDPKTGEPIRNRTIKNELAHLKLLVTSAYEWREVTGMESLNLFKLPKTRRQENFHVHLRDDEISKIFSATFDHDGARWRLILAFGLVTMLRVKVLLEFRKEWYDPKKRWITIPAEEMKGAGGEKQALSVPVCDLAVDVINRAMKRRRSSPFLFANFNGNASGWPIDSIRTLCKKTGVRYFTAHDLRRTGMTILEEAGVSPIVIARLVGHRVAGTDESKRDSPRMTNAYLGIRSDDRLREAVKVLDDSWGHLAQMTPGMSIECPQDVTVPRRKAPKNRVAPKTKTASK